jgi:hypothetical protein
MVPARVRAAIAALGQVTDPTPPASDPTFTAYKEAFENWFSSAALEGLELDDAFASRELALIVWRMTAAVRAEAKAGQRAADPPASDLEALSAEIHQLYCEQYIKDNGHPYWTGGDYCKLSEDKKECDRNIVRWYFKKVAAMGHVRFWLWRHRDDRFGPHWLAFDSEHPTLDGGDPAVLGEPEYSAVSV